MKKRIEVEIRGPLDKKDFSRLKVFLTKHGIFKDLKRRLLIDYSTLLKSQGLRNRKTDIRIRVTNGIPEIIVKLGKWGSEETREEISIAGKPGDFAKFLRLFAALGYKRGVLCLRNAEVYDYQGVELALVEVPNDSYYFEAEKVIKDEKEKNIAMEAIKSTVKTLDLNVFSEEDFFKYTERLNESVNEVFDFEKYRSKDFKKRFGV